MIQVTLQFTSIAAAVAALAKIDASAVVAAPATAATGNGTAPTPAPTAAPAAQSASAASPASSPKPAESPAKGDTPLDYEKDVKPIVIKVGAAGKRDALVDLLKKFGVAKAPEVPADKLPAFKAELEALVA